MQYFNADVWGQLQYFNARIPVTDAVPTDILLNVSRAQSPRSGARGPEQQEPRPKGERTHTARETDAALWDNASDEKHTPTILMQFVLDFSTLSRGM